MSFDFRVRMLLKGAVTLQRVIQKQHVESALRKIPREVSRKRSVRLMSDRAKDLKTFEMGIGSFPYYGSSIDIKACKKSRLWKLASCPTPLTDTSKMHSVVVFVDMAGDLGVVVKHSNTPLVFCNPSLSLTVAYETAVSGTDFVHCARLCPVNLFLGFWWRNKLRKLVDAILGKLRYLIRHVSNIFFFLR